MTANLSNRIRIEYLVSLYIFTSLLIPFSIFNFLNIHLWNISFNPVDFILKPFMIIPFVSLLLALFTEWTFYAFHYAKKLSIRIKRREGKLSLKVVEKSLPIYIIDQSVMMNDDFEMKGQTVVDMRLKDRNPLSFPDHIEVMRLYGFDRQMNIPSLLEKAHLLIRDTALKKKPITFIVDSKKERNRTISKIWLRLIVNPAAKSARTDIDTILQLVY
nr:hypothetical protein [uncultured Bacillus sp.]